MLIEISLKSTLPIDKDKPGIPIHPFRCPPHHENIMRKQFLGALSQISQ